MRKLRLFYVLGIVALTLAPAKASVIQYALTSDHCTGSCGPAGTIFGAITLTDTVANTVQVSISLNSPYEFVLTGFDVTVGWNLTGDPAIAVSGLPSGWSLLSASAGTIQMNGAGDFEYGLVCCSGNKGASNAQPSPLTFNLTASGLSTSSFQANSSLNFFAVDIYNAATSGAGAGNTGVVAATSGQVLISDTPEPASFALLGGGLLAFSWMLRNKVKREQKLPLKEKRKE